MKIKDIVNRDIVNLQNCEQEPIHIPGSIQPHGFLIAVRKDNFLVEFCSENCYNHIGRKLTELLGKKPEEVLEGIDLGLIRRQVSDSADYSARPVSININGKEYLCNIHPSEDTYVMEFEPEPAGSEDFPSMYDLTVQALSSLGKTTGLDELCQAVAEGTRTITGYDRVMIYRFDELYNGEVIAESKREDLEPFLGLHYPHTDIPVQARQLYMKNLLRMIVDINYTPVPLYTIDNSNNKNLDLSLSVLRSTSPIHVQYLKNMGVSATLTISLIHQNRLWGLIACHHYSPRFISHPLRASALFQGHFLTSQINIRQSNDEYEIARLCNEAFEKFLYSEFRNADLSFSDFVNKSELLAICNATGVCILAKGRLYRSALTPAETEIHKLIAFLGTFTHHSDFNTRELRSVYPHGESISDTASGIIYHPLSLNEADCIIWFRREVITEVHWAGEPEKAIIKDENGLHPRKSFKLWKEVLKFKSKPWLSPELNTAANYSRVLQKHVALLAITEEEEKLRILTNTLKEKNAELENINWISAHDLQEPLRKIQMTGSRLIIDLEGSGNEKAYGSVKKMNDAANRMQQLLKDLLNYSQINNVNETLSEVDLDEVAVKVKSRFSEIITEINGKVSVADLGKVNGLEFMLNKLFSNLFSNSIKFRDPAKELVINISSRIIPGSQLKEAMPGIDYLEVAFSDNGIGFDPQHAESIFRIFNKLHPSNRYEGSGIGLTLCRKIMKFHYGFISASGRPGQGADVYLFFPLNFAS